MGRFAPNDPLYTAVYPVVRYEPGDGTAWPIITHGSMAAGHAIDLIEGGEHWAIGFGTCQGHYFDAETLTIKPKQPSPARLDGMTLRNLPIGGRIEVTGDGIASPIVHPITQADEPVSFAHPGRYTLRVRVAHLLDAVFELDWPLG